MSDHHPHRPLGGDPQATPPPPFRSPAWIDPRVTHQPCQCPKCRPPGKPPRTWWRTALVLLGGVVLPLVSLGLNQAMHVVELGVLGTTLGLLTVASIVAHLIWSRREVAHETGKLEHRPPRALWARLLLLTGAALTCVFWAYLSIFFLPLLPISVILVAYLGFGLCGLCPFIIVAIGVIEVIRDYRAVRRDLPPRWALVAMIAPMVLPPLVTVAYAHQQQAERRRLVSVVDRIGAMPANLAARMRVIATLTGSERQLVDVYASRGADHTQRQVIAQVYHRLTDTVLDHSTVHRGRRAHRRSAMMRPFAFLDGRPMVHDRNWWSNSWFR